MLLSGKRSLERGNRTADDVLLALRCTACGKRSAGVHLVAGQNRNFNHGPPPSWAVELVGKPSRDQEPG